MLEKQKIEPCIPPKKNRKETIEYCKTTYKTRHKVENLFAKLKDWLDMSRFDAAPLIAFIAAKETGYWTETDGGIPPRCSADCIDQRADAETVG